MDLNAAEAGLNSKSIYGLDLGDQYLVRTHRQPARRLDGQQSLRTGKEDTQVSSPDLFYICEA
jgi:hypothetical protein